MKSLMGINDTCAKLIYKQYRILVFYDIFERRYSIQKDFLKWMKISYRPAKFKMFSLIIICGVFVAINMVCGSYKEPFLLWGTEKLSEIKTSSLSDMTEKYLIDLYNESPTIIVFIRNMSTKISDENFPIFKDILLKTKHKYITYHQFNLDPVKYNSYTKVSVKSCKVKNIYA